MKYSFICLIIVGMLVQAVEIASNEYDYYRIQLDANLVGQQDLYFIVNSKFDFITMRCDSSFEIFGSVQNTNQMIIYNEDRVKMVCSNSEFAIGLSYNTQIQTINVQIYGLDDYIQLADNNYTNERYMAPTVQLVNNRYTIGYTDQTFTINTEPQNQIYVEMYRCSYKGLKFHQIQEDGTNRSIKSENQIVYDTLNTTTAKYQVLGSDSSGAPQYMIKVYLQQYSQYQQYSLDKTIPYDRIYASRSYIPYSQQDNNLVFTIPGIYTSISYTKIQFFIIIGKSYDLEYFKCYLADQNSNKAQLIYYYGSDTQNPEITVYQPNPSFDYAIAYVKVTTNDVTITKLLGTTYFSYAKIKTGTVVLPISIILIGLFLIIFAVIRYRMKLKQQQNIQQPLVAPNIPQQVYTQQSYQINN